MARTSLIDLLAELTEDNKDTVKGDVVLRFGGGQHSSASEEDILETECASGRNFLLDAQNRQFRPRKGFKYLGTAPNGSELRGMAFLRQADGTNTMLVQAAGTVYQYANGIFTSVGSCQSTAKLRGRLEHNFTLDDKVIITDLNLAEEVHEWNGATFQQVTFTDETISGAFGTFRAKYCYVSNERAIFANIHDNGTNFPHLIVGSKRGQFEQISTAQRPSSSLSEEEPWFLVQPDLRPINGLVHAFGQSVISSDAGSLYILEGASAKDFSVRELFPRSGAFGDESVIYAGNDIYYGRQGRIESVAATDQYGDVEANDLSIVIRDAIEDYDDWTGAYNQRLQRAYFLADGTNELWVLFKTLLGGQESPWARWTTAHALNFAPSVMMNGINPDDGLEYVFLGDSSGNLYQLESDETADAGSTPIIVERTSKLFSLPTDEQAFAFQGWILYRRDEAFTVTITIEYQGLSVYNQEIEVTTPAVTRKVYGGGLYYSNGEYYSASFTGKLERQILAAAGKGNEFQITAKVDASIAWIINEIGFKFRAA